MESRFGRYDADRYRWRGDGAASEILAMDYGSAIAGGPRRGDAGPADTLRGVERGRQTSDSRLIHWDLFEPDDAGSRTA